MISIVDYGAGNIKSIFNMLKRIGVKSEITNSLESLDKAEKIILPGVGHFDYGMQNLKSSGLIECLNRKVLKDKVPFLGICLGAQLLGIDSEEGTEKGLAWIPMHVRKFKMDEGKLKVPHMGWNYVNIKVESQLFTKLENEARFYFVHSYFMDPIEEDFILAKTSYGNEFVSAVRKENIFGVQFHPEKSHAYGMQMLKNFSLI